MSPVTIRRAVPSDLPDLVELSVRTFVETFGGSNDPVQLRQYVEENLNPERLGEELGHPGSAFFLATFSGEIAAYMKINRPEAQTDEVDPDALEIQRIYVLDRFKKQGIGRQLIRHAKALAAADCYGAIWLGVWELNHGAIAFYEQMGFQKIGSHSFFLGEEEQTDHIMKLMIR